eukprot:GHRR01005053.1.p1 GENE.GHRR01005053.1~~GHRR01005053.1.p1  ORF type:complete len:233 (+),score=48.68 GHRR01005053.1:159-857(+)
MTRTLSLAIAMCLATHALAAGTYEVLQSTSYTQLANTSGQWNITVAATRAANKSAFEPVSCTEEKSSAACNQPLLNADAQDKLQVTAALKDSPLRTIDDLPATKLWVKACYAKPSTADRPWRKADNVIDKDKSCPYIVKSTDFNQSTYTFQWPVPKNMTKAVWYAQVLVQCQNGTEMSFCQYDDTRNESYWGTNTINSTPSGMIVATAVCSAIGPLFLGVYFLKDKLTRKSQ